MAFVAGRHPTQEVQQKGVSEVYGGGLLEVIRNVATSGALSPRDRIELQVVCCCLKLSLSEYVECESIFFVSNTFMGGVS